ncbi:hypothetical protein LU699_12995 [Luteimonas fraxinea]|uniref:hypothetical protein n=1 Tax=Luteimonas fraxinea TaxID=2901869 RepID=UPI001E507F30|nr:hypothetical protein [Luteimonas fraxinea]UHH09205.1 hypothetical protein LU699_12995 [Luteimonas fraxinea]
MGLRISEVSQLKLANVIQDEGLWCLDIRATMDEALDAAQGRASDQRQGEICDPLPADPLSRLGCRLP